MNFARSSAEGGRRLFFALWPDPATRAALAAAAARVDVRAARRVRPEHLHLTLLFLGATPAAAMAALLEQATPAVAPFTLHIALAGWWRRSRVAWLAPVSVPPELTTLHAALAAHARRLGLAAERDELRPHVTVARGAERAARTAEPFAVDWQVTDFALIESCSEARGTRYELRRRWPLAAQARD